MGLGVAPENGAERSWVHSRVDLGEKYGRHATQALCGPSVAGTAGPKATKSSDLSTRRGRLLSVRADAPLRLPGLFQAG